MVPLKSAGGSKGVLAKTFSFRPGKSWRPPVLEPKRKDFGSRLIESSLRSYGIIRYEAQGLVVETDMPLSKLSSHSDLENASINES